MNMLGSLGRQKSRRGYSRLGGSQPMLDVFEEGAAQKMTEEEDGGKPKRKSTKDGGGGTTKEAAHPLQKVLEAPRMDRAMSKPEFMRYLAYVKEAGRWDADSDRPALSFD